MHRQVVAVWVAYAALVAAALATSWHDQLLVFTGPGGIAKAVVWLAWFGFVGYSVQASRKENFRRSITALNRLWWGRQVGIDLYLGIGLGLGVMYLDGGGVVLVAWLLPTLFFANLAVLPYVAFHFESIVAGFV